MKKTVNKSFPVLIFIALFFFNSCNRDVDEFRFTGHVVGSQLCSSSQIGYAIDIIEPDSIGKPINISGTQYQNVVMAYRASRILHQGDTIKGVAYITKSYAELNCFGISEYDLPEVILLSCDE
jgi:hypothetical protein